MNDLLNEFSEVKECEYKNERYSVRDNGAVMRHFREGMRARRLDGVWTFGKPNEKTGYMEFCGEKVHRIVAFAFHGNPPTEQHVVDHIDTNRRNNRPENLRWLTRLENVMNNPITLAKIESICSIEEFLADPSILRGHENEDPNFSWMRTVSAEEAQASFKRLKEWSKNPRQPKGAGIGEWIYQDPNTQVDYRMQSGYEKPEVDFNTRTKLEKVQLDNMMRTGYRKPILDYGTRIEEEYSFYKQNVEEKEAEPVSKQPEEMKIEPETVQSLTPNAVQLNWKVPSNFPCCPQEFSGNPLESYMANLQEGAVFCSNHYGDSHVLRFGMPNPESLWVMCSVEIGFKRHAFTQITFKDGLFYHYNRSVLDFGDDPESIFDSIMKGDIG